MRRRRLGATQPAGYGSQSIEEVGEQLSSAKEVLLADFLALAAAGKLRSWRNPAGQKQLNDEVLAI